MENMEDFKADLTKLSSLQIVRKHVFNGQSKILCEDMVYELKEEICSYLNIDFNDVVLVGSGKMGFSIKPSRRYGEFNDDSDLDIAIVSPHLFHTVWKEAFAYKKSRAYWPDSSSFFQFLAAGWVRPDKLPSSKYFEFTEHWWNFFNKVTSSAKYGPYKIRAGLYQSWFFLEEYQKICVEQCMDEAKK